MDLSVLSCFNEKFRVVVIKISPCVEYQPCVLCCGDHAHRNSRPLHKRTENYSENGAVRPTAKTARQNPGVGIFSGMLTLDLDLGLNTNVGAQEILHLLTKNGSFFYCGQRVMNFLVTPLCCPVFTKLML
jgi:hypothetical protein